MEETLHLVGCTLEIYLRCTDIWTSKKSWICFMFHVRALKNDVYLCDLPTNAHLKICSLTKYLLLVKNNNMW